MGFRASYRRKAMRMIRHNQTFLRTIKIDQRGTERGTIIAQQEASPMPRALEALLWTIVLAALARVVVYAVRI